jgi:hypothetical protein
MTYVTRILVQKKLRDYHSGFYKALLLGCAALEMTERHGERRVASAEAALRSVLHQVGGRP